MIESAERPVRGARAYVERTSVATVVARAMLAMAALAGTISLASGPNWTLLWGALVLTILAVTTGSVLRRLGYGQSR